MGVIKFSKTNCRNCYSCIRACDVKAIRVKNEQAEIIEERCIACGKCIKACHKNAKRIESDIDKLKKFIKTKERIAASIAPSFVAAFGQTSDKLCAALKLLGITYVEETAIGAELVSKEYEKFSSILDGNSYITSCCPALNDLIQKHHPNLIENLIPVISPMVCHKRIMKKKYGEEIKVIFIGPCIAKKNEAKEEAGIDAVITFDELINYLEEEKIDLNILDKKPFDDISTTQRRYPILGGILYGMDKARFKREVLHIDGMEDCCDVLRQIEKGKFKNTFIEMNLCRHGCIDGPAMPDNGLTCYERLQLVKDHAKDCQENNIPVNKLAKITEINMKKEFKTQYKPLKIPSEEEFKEILARIGKYSLKDELNCGTCGYKTCKDKAIAVYNDMAEPTMCLPFMKQKAENLSNVIFDMTPTIIVVVDKKLKIIDYNPAAETFFNVTKNHAIGLELSMLMELEDINEFLVSDTSILTQKVHLPYQDATVIESIIRIEDSDAILILINDFTETLRKEEKHQKMKINAIDMAQKVIDKQMIVAQEIASLLGETTAETKVYLTKLKKLVEGEEVELK